MKINQFILFICVLCMFSSCRSEKIIVNKKIINTEGEPMLIGRITTDALTSLDFKDWYLKEYDSYIPKKKFINTIRRKAKFYRIEIFLGTWCSDTQEQLPRFLKILDESKFPKKKIELYALNKNKESFYGEQNQKGITRIPVFIIYKGENEIGRITETPTHETLEEDLYNIFLRK